MSNYIIKAREHSINYRTALSIFSYPRSAKNALLLSKTVSHCG